MRFVLEIDMSNDAFAGNPGDEVARILNEKADNLSRIVWKPSPGLLSRIVWKPSPGLSGPLLDSNGNTCGTWRVERAAPRKARA